jgi:hypothetical protein
MQDYIENDQETIPSVINYTVKKGDTILLNYK